MNKESILEKIKEAGVVGVGGAGFPAHVKLSANADVVIANGAECEPLLRTDRAVMENYPEKVVTGLKVAMLAAGAKKGVIALKKKYEKAIDALKGAISERYIELYLMDSFYPAGDEQQIVYEVTGNVVPTGGLPLDAGAVVQNVSTLSDITGAISGKPVIERLVTVTGEVRSPAVYRAPVGLSVGQLIQTAHGPDDMEGYSVIIGGPAMGIITSDIDAPVTKTTGGVIVLKNTHPLIRKRTGDFAQDLKLAKSVCCQCNYCTLLCPRNALGLSVEPHKIMRAVALGGKDIGDVNGVFSCSDCGICTHYACNFSLAPSRMMQRVKAQLIKEGVKPIKRVATGVSGNINDIKVPVSRLMSRLGIDEYDRDLSLIDTPLPANRVRLPLKMHIGAPAVSLVQTGESVQRGQKIAACEGMGAHVHASIAGVVSVADTYIDIEG